MLLSLTVNNFTLVEQLHMDFQPGMTAITGETGAGKSLVLDALGMALGDRGDTGRIRTDKDKLDVTAIFAIGNNSQARQWLDDNELLDGDECIIRRTLSAEGRSRGFINGQPATMQQLQQLGEMMIDIHSQHEHQSLLIKDTHRRLLDAFAGCDDLCSSVQYLFKQWQNTRKRLFTLQNNSEETEARRQLLSFQLEELDSLALAEGEIEQLEREQHLLANGEQILRDSHQIIALCKESDQGDALSLLSQALNLLQLMPEKSDMLREAETLLDSARIQVDEAAREIQRHIDSFDINPERLQEVEDRLSLCYQLARKHKISAGEIPALQLRLREELQQLGDGEDGLEGLTKKLADIDQQLCREEDKLSAKRRAAATRFADLVNRQLQNLAMASASLEVSLTALSEHSPQGRETIEFLVSTNPGQPHKPLNKVASGGELSRISLAIQVIAAQHTEIPTLVFDEVDVGIGGAVAEVVGRLLRSLGDNGQVICVTHLPQVASCAHHHLIASKKVEGAITESELSHLNLNARIHEIARMLGGSKMTDQTLAHAEEMLNLSSGQGG
ncbi:MAG: DNA repair protein RecN [Porticoccaceae bacterium]